MVVEFGVLERAVASLREALARPPANDLERDGVIQRFEYTFELMWKTSKRVLDTMGIKSNSPRSVIRDLAQQGFISDASAWMVMLNARNYTSHIYDESVAKWVFSVCAPFLHAAETLILKLKAEVKK
ncbi:MAG: nucleotidyltransferase substrate binding protein [Pseudomonadota bacterium]|jgi:nucleotidyltransferase substrate binding protein (TIGR01987 family)